MCAFAVPSRPSSFRCQTTTRPSSMPRTPRPPTQVPTQAPRDARLRNLHGHLDLTEKALEALDTGREEEADKLIEQAKKLDPSAVEEVVQDLEEAATSDPDAARRAGG